MAVVDSDGGGLEGSQGASPGGGEPHTEGLVPLQSRVYAVVQQSQVTSLPQVKISIHTGSQLKQKYLLIT